MATILVIDDDPEITRLLDELLTGAGYRVLTASDGRIAMHLLDAFICDVVITDIVMPEMDGFEVIMNLHKRNQRPKIIAMTCATDILGHNYLSSVAKSMSVSRVLRKPFLPEEVLEAVAGRDKATVLTMKFAARPAALLKKAAITCLNAA